MTTRKSPKRTPKDPATPRRATRSAGKARATGRSSTVRPYAEDVRAEALRLVESQGIAHAHAAHGIPKPTLTRWAKAAGIDLGEQARARTAKATEATIAKAAEARLTTTQLLEQLIDRSGSYLVTATTANDEAAALIAALDPDRIRLEVGLAGPYAVVEDAAAQAAQRRAMALSALPMEIRDAVGVLTRSIHDLALTTGQATERGELVVNFGVPRPNALEADVTVVDEAQLAIGGGAG